MSKKVTNKQLVDMINKMVTMAHESCVYEDACREGKNLIDEAANLVGRKVNVFRSVTLRMDFDQIPKNDSWMQDGDNYKVVYTDESGKEHVCDKYSVTVENVADEDDNSI